MVSGRSRVDFSKRQTLLGLLAAGTVSGSMLLTQSSVAQSLGRGPSRTRVPTTAMGQAAIGRVRGRLQFSFDELGLSYGAPIYLRLIKDQKRLEVWVQGRRQTYIRLRAYRVCGARPSFGPRRNSRTPQPPEGFYQIGAESLRPPNVAYLGMDVGWPNAFDMAQNWRGVPSLLQAGCASEPHFGLTDPDMEEVYALVYAALSRGQGRVPVHIFPFEMSRLRMLTLGSNANVAFWQQLAPAWWAFESTKKPPRIQVSGRRYVVTSV